jgi:hypothetical protein
VAQFLQCIQKEFLKFVMRSVLFLILMRLYGWIGGYIYRKYTSTNKNSSWIFKSRNIRNFCFVYVGGKNDLKYGIENDIFVTYNEQYLIFLLYCKHHDSPYA